MKITISIDEETYKKAKNYAELSERTFSGLIRLALNKLLEREEKNVQ